MLLHIPSTSCSYEEMDRRTDVSIVQRMFIISESKRIELVGIVTLKLPVVYVDSPL